MIVTYDATDNNPLVVAKNKAIKEASRKCPCCGETRLAGSPCDDWGILQRPNTWDNIKWKWSWEHLKHEKWQATEFHCITCGSNWISDWYKDTGEY